MKRQLKSFRLAYLPVIDFSAESSKMLVIDVGDEKIRYWVWQKMNQRDGQRNNEEQREREQDRDFMRREREAPAYVYIQIQI